MALNNSPQPAQVPVPGNSRMSCLLKELWEFVLTCGGSLEDWLKGFALSHPTLKSTSAEVWHLSKTFKEKCISFYRLGQWMQVEMNNEQSSQLPRKKGWIMRNLEKKGCEKLWHSPKNLDGHVHGQKRCEKALSFVSGWPSSSVKAKSKTIAPSTAQQGIEAELRHKANLQRLPRFPFVSYTGVKISVQLLADH